MARQVPRFHRSIRNVDSYREYVEKGDQESWQKLRKDLQPTIDSAIQSFAAGDRTMRVRAAVLAKQAVESYDPDNPSGTSLTTHVYNHLKRLNRFREQRNSPVHYPESVRNDRRAIYKFKREFEERNQREPSQAEIQDSMGLSRKRIRKALGMIQDSPTSAMRTDKGHMVAEDVSDKDVRRRKRMDMVYVDQDSAGKKIMEWGMGYGGEKTRKKADIAARLGISAPAVSQRISSIINKVEAPELYDESSTDMRPDSEPDDGDLGYSEDFGVKPEFGG